MLFTGPFRSVSLKLGLARGNSWHKFMDESHWWEGRKGRRRGRCRQFYPFIFIFFPPVAFFDNPDTLTLERSLQAQLWLTAGIEKKKLKQRRGMKVPKAPQLGYSGACLGLVLKMFLKTFTWLYHAIVFFFVSDLILLLLSFVTVKIFVWFLENNIYLWSKPFFS